MSFFQYLYSELKYEITALLYWLDKKHSDSSPI